MVNYRPLFQKYVSGLVLFGIVGLILSSTILYTNRFCKQYASSRSLEENVNLDCKVLVQPCKYTPVMSSTPGMCINVQDNRPFEKVYYAAERGTFLTWDPQTGRVTEHGNALEMGADRDVYWTPYESENRYSQEKNNIITVVLWGNGQKIAEKKVTIIFDGLMYTVES